MKRNFNLKNVKSIRFNVNFEGVGCVNFDETSQKWFLKAAGLLKGDASTNDNNLFAKKVFFSEGEDEYGFKYKVSSECIRHAIFDDTMPYQNPTVANIPSTLYTAIAHPDMLTRGYVITRGKDGKDALRKKSIFAISDAVEVGSCRHLMDFDFHTRSGNKKDGNAEADTKSTSIYRKENVGNLNYTSSGFINLLEAQFISADLLYDRMAVDVDGGVCEEIYLSTLKRNLVNFDPKFRHYYKTNCIVKDEFSERGILLNEESVDMLVKRLLKNILNIHIERRGAYLNTMSLTIWVNTNEGESESFEVTLDNIDDFYFGYYPSYTEADNELIKKNKEKMDAHRELVKSENTNKNKEEDSHSLF
jgi:hypothetical protein